MKYIWNNFHWFTARYMGRSVSFYSPVTGPKSDYLSTIYYTYIYTIWYVSVCGSVSVSTAFRKRSQSPPTVCCRRVCLIANCITLNIHKHNEYTHVRVCQNRHKQLPLNPGESGSTNVPQNGNGNGLRCNLKDWQKFWLFCSV